MRSVVHAHTRKLNKTRKHKGFLLIMLDFIVIFQNFYMQECVAGKYSEDFKKV